jgi:acetylornithine/succinyldiaminopimelate/putrescine aminotransferase
LSQTFTGSTSAIKASYAIIRHLLNGNYFGEQGKISHIHATFTEHLLALHNKYPDLIEGPFGIGCMIAFTPYKGDFQKVTNYIQRLFEAGVISMIAGSRPSRVRFLVPAAAITEQDIASVMGIVEKTLLEGS